MPTPTTNETRLVASNARLELELVLPPSNRGVTYPGSILRPIVKFKDGESGHYSDVKLRLIAETRETIMGKERWQAGSGLNAALGGSAVGIAGMPLTSSESIAFFDHEIPLVSSSSSAIRDANQSEKPSTTTTTTTETNGAALSSTSSSKPSFAPGTQAVFEFVLLTPPPGHIIPTVPARQNDSVAKVSVVWQIVLEGIRKGLLRRNDSLTIELPVVFPSPPPAHSTSSTLVHPLKFESGSSEGMTLQADLSVVPISHRAPLDFHLVLTPSSTSAAHILSSSTLKLTASLARQIRTTPILRPENGRNFDWAPIRIAQGDVEKVEGKDWEWKGRIEVPDEECTVETRGLGIKYALTCHIVSTVLAQAAMHVSTLIFLPSTPYDLDLPSDHLPTNRSPDDPTGELPAYAT